MAASLKGFLWFLLFTYPLNLIILSAMLLFVAISHLMRNPWYMRFMGNNLAYSCLTFRQRKKYSTLIAALNITGLILSYPAQWIHNATHSLLYGPVRNRFIVCRSYEDAYARAKAASDGKEPVSHPPHKEGDLHHFHLNGHSLVYRDGHRENPHFQYRS